MSTSELTPVVEYFRQVGTAGAERSFESVLHGLAQLLAADAIGLSPLDSGAPDVAVGLTPGQRELYPWRTDASLLDRLYASRSAETVASDAGDWLICLVWEPVVGEPRLAWAHRPAPRSWNETDKWSWLFASQALVRWQTPSACVAAALGKRLEQAAAVTGRLSHDFGNYLTGIMGFTELSLTQAPADGILNRYLQEVLQAARDGAEWIHRLHLFCRRSAPRAWPTLLASVLAEEEARLRSAGVQSVRWAADLPADLPLVDIDAVAMQTILAELVKNAREAGKDEGSITFTARVRELTQADCGELLGAAKPGTFVELTVADDGPGFPPEARARLFRDMFFSTKPRHRGLGLLVVYGILQRFRGGLRIGAPERGTTVQLYLPVAALDGPMLADGVMPHLLLVHTDPVLFESLRKILETSGCRVTIANSALTALATYRTPAQSFALVVTDVQLPHMSGLDLARRILDHDAKASFLFLHTQSSFHGLAEEELFKRFPLLRWPLEPSAVVKAVRSSLARSNERKEAAHGSHGSR